ncbi:MAG: hypothetical protein V3V08_12185 [Nannocystaceae bacterium]
MGRLQKTLLGTVSGQAVSGQAVSGKVVSGLFAWVICWGPSWARADPTTPLGLASPLDPSKECDSCHLFSNRPQKADEPNYSPGAWVGSMMANASRDPVFWAGVAVAHQDAPGETEICIRCHSPRAFLEGRGAAIAIHELQPQDHDAVACDLCHRMIEDAGAPLGNAGYLVDDVLVDGKIPRRGPWSYGGDEAPKHGWSEEHAFLASSELCGTCHDVTTPRERVDDDGNGMGVGFNEQRTYSEWRGSDFAVAGSGFRSCQDCHMPKVEDAGGCKTFDNEDNAHPTGARRHDLVGANRFMIGLLKEEYGSSGAGEVGDIFFDLALARIDELLATAATLELEAPASVDLGVGLDAVQVQVTNNTGHKLPTGYSEGRVMWIEIVARYEGEAVYSSGRWNQATGIEADAQLRRYEAVAEDSGDGSTFHLLRNDRWVVDNRLPPQGLAVGDVETDPVGDRYTPTPDGVWPHYDTVAYRWPASDAVVPSAGEPRLEIEARLLYLINTPRYVAFLDSENVTNNAGERLKALFDAKGGAVPLVLATANRTVMIESFGEGGDSGGDSDGDSGGETTTSGAGPTAGPTGGATAGPTAGSGASNGGTTGEPGGCACSSGGEGGRWWLLSLGFALRRRRGVRRRRFAN